jgi:branched-chain amino acid transport system ATP-binding protein
MANPLLAVDHLGVAYGDVRAVWDVSFHVDPGEIVVLIGPNGAGKTTLMRAIAGLEPPVAGSVRYDGQPIQDAASRTPAHALVERGIILVHEGRHLFRHMTVRENLDLGAYLPRARAAIETTRRHVFDLFPRLDERQHQRVSTMSGGEQQMVAIGRAMMGLPRLLLLDEPSLGLAPLIVRNIFGVIQTLHEEGTTLLLVEQNARRALALADRAYVIEQGRIVSEGTGEALLHDAGVQRAYLGGG